MSDVPLDAATSLWDLVEERAIATPDGTMAIDEAGRVLTYGRYRNESLEVAAGFAALGVTAGTHVCWQLPTRIDTFLVMAALARLGAVQVPLLTALRARELRHITGAVDPELLVVAPSFRGFDHAALASELAGERQALRVVLTDPDPPRGDPSTLAPHPSSEPDEVRWLYYTSGTTGEPKGARHTDRSIIAAGAGMGSGPRVEVDDRVPFVFPVSHIGGAVWLSTMLLTGCTALVVETYAGASTIDWLDANGMTIGSGGTVFVLNYLDHARSRRPHRVLPSVRVFLGGAAPKPPGLHDALKGEFGGVGLLSSYGMTECPIATCGRLDDPEDTMATTEGPPTPAVEIVVEEGELLVRGPQLFRGYVDPAQDEGAFDVRGFFRTGDLGRVDDRGFVTITGRLKEIIIRKGESISAKEIEDLLHGHPTVADVAVVGVPDPDAGERVCAVVVNVDPAQPLTFDEMTAYLRKQQLMVQKIPERLEVVDELPRNATGKVLKHDLVARYS